MNYLYNKYILMPTAPESPLSRSKGFSNGRFTGEGQSGIQAQRDIYNQRLPVMKGDTNTMSQSLMDGENVRTRWELHRNTTVDNVGNLSEYAAGEAKNLLVERIRRGGGKRHRPSRKYKKSAKRVFRKKSRATRRR